MTWPDPPSTMKRPYLLANCKVQLKCRCWELSPALTHVSSKQQSLQVLGINTATITKYFTVNIQWHVGTK